ncbi:hypothetical protein JOH48_007933 [Bradyrhizobium elkanii]|nr:hypothetical protein [Bradyrhizobium elkanii]
MAQKAKKQTARGRKQGIAAPRQSGSGNEGAPGSCPKARGTFAKAARQLEGPQSSTRI